MAVAFDNVATIGSGSSITPVSSTPKGVLAIYAFPTMVDVTAITCDGIGMTQVAEFILDSLEPGTAGAYFLGTGIPTSQPLTITSTPGITMVVYTLTGDEDLTVVDFNGGAVDGGNPGAVPVTIDRDCFVAGAIHSSTNTLAGINIPSGTTTDRATDHGSSCSKVVRLTAVASPPTATIDWTGSFPSEHEVITVAIGEGPTVTEPESGWGVLLS